jgi:hypothetical protein
VAATLVQHLNYYIAMYRIYAGSTVVKLALFEVVLRKAPLERAISNAPVGLQLQRPIESLRAQPVIVAALAVALLARDVAQSVIRGHQRSSEVIRGHQRSSRQ